uniref:Uncharacterized protein n=1 Tax=Brassica oleracea TaxID=3712 RepID=A0A3P6EWB6_BRAOL|nr:unnamed protein product [Brassica oleracea]
MNISKKLIAMNIFKKTTPKDALRTSKREMAVATRGIEREISSLQLEEKRLVAEIKKTAKTGNEARTNFHILPNLIHQNF